MFFFHFFSLEEREREKKKSQTTQKFSRFCFLFFLCVSFISPKGAKEKKKEVSSLYFCGVRCCILDTSFAVFDVVLLVLVLVQEWWRVLPIALFSSQLHTTHTQKVLYSGHHHQLTPFKTAKKLWPTCWHLCTASY